MAATEIFLEGNWRDHFAGARRPKEIFGELRSGEAYVPPGHEKTTRFVIDLTTSKAVPEAEFGKP